MIKIENTEIFNFQGSLRGMRNPLESWDKSDSHNNPDGTFYLGQNDLTLAQKLIIAGKSHSKFLRQITVSFDITAPIYFYKEMDTYKISTVRNSTSTMHKLATTPITENCFSFDNPTAHCLRSPLTKEKDIPDNIDSNLIYNSQDIIIDICEGLRLKYLETKDTRYWRALIQLLPSGWNQMSTFTCNYENLRSIYFDRRHHKLTEWHTFCDWIETLPYAKELIIYKGDK